MLHEITVSSFTQKESDSKWIQFRKKKKKKLWTRFFVHFLVKTKKREKEIKAPPPPHIHALVPRVLPSSNHFSYQ